jgi:hypothetical protein
MMLFPFHSGKKDKRSQDLNYVDLNFERAWELSQESASTGRDKIIREYLCDANNWLERNEGWTYGLSQGVIDNLHMATGKKYNPNRAYFEVEHSIPVKFIIQHLRTQIKTKQEAVEYLHKALHLFLITKDENKLLSKYKSSMPKESQPDDTMARYNAVGITIVKKWSRN